MLHIPKALAALVLSAGLLALSPAAHAYQDTTPYGLIFASGTITTAGGGLGNDTSTYFQPTGEQDQVSLAFFRPPTGPLTSPISFGGYLPGSVRITKADGTVLLDVSNVQPTYVYFAFWYGPFAEPIAIAIVPITYQGQSATMQVSIVPSVDFGTAQVNVVVNDNSGNYLLWRAGNLQGFDVVDP